MRKSTPETTLPQYEGPRTPRMEFEDVLGDLVMTAARFGKRSGKHGEEVEYWERSPAGKHVAFSTYQDNGNPFTVAAGLAIYAPSRVTRLMTAVRGGFAAHVDLNHIIGLDFVMNEPQEAANDDLPPVAVSVELADASILDYELTYEQFHEICEGSGVYEQNPLPRHKRLAAWVMSHLRRSSPEVMDHEGI